MMKKEFQLGIIFLFVISIVGASQVNNDREIKVAAAQILTDFDIEANEKKITQAIIEAANVGCEIVLFHEGCLTNYPVGEDIKRIDFVKVCAAES